MLVGPVVSKHVTFGFVAPRTVFTNALNVFAFQETAAFALLQSSVHVSWALRHASSLRVDPRYNPTDCFETFPFPKGWNETPAIDDAGAEYYAHRARMMESSDQGLTRTYNRFHDPEDQSANVVKLRELHREMDRAVLDAYGWGDVPKGCEFFLDHEDEDDAGSTTRSKRWRYRWPDDIHDDVLARLLALNARRAAEEQRSGAAGGATRATKRLQTTMPAPQVEKLP